VSGETNRIFVFVKLGNIAKSFRYTVSPILFVFAIIFVLFKTVSFLAKHNKHVQNETGYKETKNVHRNTHAIHVSNIGKHCLFISLNNNDNIFKYVYEKGEPCTTAFVTV